jgi:DNA-binding response OmpR family regulator
MTLPTFSKSNLDNVMPIPKKPITPWTFVLDEPLRILIVDDDPILREFASVHLNSPVTTIDTACDGIEARNLLSLASYDVALLDIEMPKLDGFSLLQEIRSDEKLSLLRVIMLTGHDDIASIDRAYQLGADSFATKPVNWRQLSYQIRYVVRTSLSQNSPDASREPHPLSALTSSQAAGRAEALLQTIMDHVAEIERQQALYDNTEVSSQVQGLRQSARALAAYLAPRTLDAGCADPAARQALERQI